VNGNSGMTTRAPLTMHNPRGATTVFGFLATGLFSAALCRPIRTQCGRLTTLATFLFSPALVGIRDQ
jgi:hypothetical protein